MKVFADYHHGDLYHSLHLLFEKRLGWELYSPIGSDWHKRGFWRYSENPATIEQYLGFSPGTQIVDGVYMCPDVTHKTIRKAITPEKFMSMDIDIVLASVYNHEQSFYEMSQHKKNCKFVRQEGNNIAVMDFNIVKNIMSSTTAVNVPFGVNAVFYHQEFDTDIFSYSPSGVTKRITTLMNCYPHALDYPLWNLYKKELPEFDWKMHGILGEDGIIDGLENISKAISESSFIWHLKSQGDGFGHTIHNSYACGRPCIIKAGYYAGRLAEPLLEDGVTCIDLDKANMQENVKRIRHFSEPENHKKMCDAAYKRFKNVVDYDAEFERIKKFLENLI